MIFELFDRIALKLAIKPGKDQESRLL